MKNMDKHFNKAWAVAACLSFLLLLACGKTELEDVVNNPEDYAVVYLRQAVEGVVSYQFPVVEERPTILLNANYGGVDYPGKDITVEFKAMPELVSAYNVENNTNYPELPANAYALLQTSALIGKGRLYSSPVSLEIDMMKLPGIAPHLLPVGISSVSEGVRKNEALSVVYLLVEGTFLSNPYPLFDRTAWTISASSVNGKNEAARLLDDDLATYWSSSLSAAKPHEVLVDLNESKLVHGCVINARRSSSNPELARDAGNPTEIEVQTSQDGIDWEYTESFSLSYKASPEDVEYTQPEETVYLGYGQQARYVKIRIHGSMGTSYAWFSELTIF